jgi:hypothetical protein
MIKTYTTDHTVLNTKGQKIIAALFLVTGHLSETDPLRAKLRSLAVGLTDCPHTELSKYCATINALLNAARYAGLISEGNANIISAELTYFGDPTYRSDTLVSGLFPAQLSQALDKGHVSDKRTSHQDMSFKLKKTSDSGYSGDSSNSVAIQKDRKDQRQDKILSYITVRKSASIKDVAALFPDVSEKTIQRELNTLVSSGKINKRGDKRWSLYLAA